MNIKKKHKTREKKIVLKRYNKSLILIRLYISVHRLEKYCILEVLN